MHLKDFLISNNEESNIRLKSICKHIGLCGHHY
nr:MAG TPA: Saposin-like type B, region 2 [Caudoviricetes sp.]